MMCLLAMLVGSGARAADEPAERARTVPIRIVAGAGFRRDAAAGTRVEAGIALAPRRGVHVDLGLSFTAFHIFTLPGPRRSFASVDGLVDVGVDVGRYLTAGPTAGVGVRLFRQQGQHLEQLPVGLVGAKAEITLLRSRLLGILTSVRVLVDTRAVDLVLATSQVRRMPRAEAHVALGFVLLPRRRP